MPATIRSREPGKQKARRRLFFAEKCATHEHNKCREGTCECDCHIYSGHSWGWTDKALAYVPPPVEMCNVAGCEFAAWPGTGRCGGHDALEQTLAEMEAYTR